MPTEKSAVLDRLRRQKSAEPDSDLEKVREEWVGAIKTLMAQIRAWLADAVAEGLFTVEPEEVSLVEERLGTYQTEGLRLGSPNGDSIRITPKARQVVSAYGRVDLLCSSNKIILVRPDLDRWRAARLVPERGGWVYTDLGEEAFWQAIGDLLP